MIASVFVVAAPQHWGAGAPEFYRREGDAKARAVELINLYPHKDDAPDVAGFDLYFSSFRDRKTGLWRGGIFYDAANTPNSKAQYNVLLAWGPHPTAHANWRRIFRDRDKAQGLTYHPATRQYGARLSLTPIP